MEKQINQFITQILESNTSKIDDSFLDKYYELFDTKKYLEKDFDSIYEDMETAYDIKKYSIPYDDKSTAIYKQLVLSVVNIFDTKKRLKVIPLIVYLDIENILYTYLYVNNYFDSFIEAKDYFIDTLKDSSASVDTKNLSKHHWESEAYESYKKGLEQKDFTKIYNFIEAVQRGNFMYEPYMDFLSFVSVKMFFDDFINVLDSINDIFKIKYLLNNLTTKEKLLLADKTKNILVKFDAIRSSVYFQSTHHSCSNLLKDENEFISKLMLSLTEDKQVWKDFLQYFLIYPSRNPQLFLPLADVLNQSNDDILDIFIDSYEDYMGNLFLTDVIDIAIVYIREFLLKEVIEKEIAMLILNIEEIDNHWFKDSSEQGNYLYKQLSKLFVFSFSVEKHRLDNLKNEIKLSLQNIEKDLRREYSYRTKSTMQLFNEYLV